MVRVGTIELVVNVNTATARALTDNVYAQKLLQRKKGILAVVVLTMQMRTTLSNSVKF